MFRLPSLTALRTFAVAARARTLAGAADELAVTQPAVSHQIRLLEQELGVKLFVRQGRRLRLNETGRELAEVLDEALAMIAAGCRRATASQARHTITIAAIASVATCWLAPQLARFMAANPGVGVRLIYELAGLDNAAGDADLAIRYGRGRWPGMDATLLFDGAAAPVAAARLVGAGGRDLAVSAYRSFPLLHDVDKSGWRTWLAGAGAPVGGDDDLEGPVFADFALLRAAVLAGQGIALCPPALLRPELASGELVQLSDKTIDSDKGYYLVRPRARADRAAVDSFARWLVDLARDAETAGGEVVKT